MQEKKGSERDKIPKRHSSAKNKKGCGKDKLMSQWVQETACPIRTEGKKLSWLG
jgi:hypothetical protein